MRYICNVCHKSIREAKGERPVNYQPIYGIDKKCNVVVVGYTKAHSTCVR